MTPGGDGAGRPSDISRRRLLTGIGGVGAIGMASGLGTGAYLSDRETFRNNVFGAGEVGLTVDGNPTDGIVTVGPFEVDRTTFDGRPDPGTFEIEASANPVRVWLATDCPDDDPLDDDSLGNALEVEVVVDGESLTDGHQPLDEVERLLATGRRIDDGCLEAGPDGGSIVVEVSPYLPADAPDELASSDTDLTFRLYAEQCRHITEAEANKPGANPFVETECDSACVPCEDENGVAVGSLTLRYLGDDPATVAVVATGGGGGGTGNGGTTVFEGEVNPDGTFVVDGTASPTNGDPGWIGPNIYLDDGSTDADPETDEDGGNSGNGGNGNGKGGSGGNGGGHAGVKIHTSCSVPLRVGDVYGGLYEITAAATTDGQPICGTEEN